MNRTASTSAAVHALYRDRAADFGRVLVVSFALSVAGCGSGKSADISTPRQQVSEGKYDLALPLLKSLLVEQPNSAEARYLLGVSLLRKRDPKAAEVELRKARELGQPDVQVVPALAEALLNLGKADRVLSEFAALKLADRAAQAALLATVAEAYMQKGQIDLAKEAANAALASSSTNIRAELVVARLEALQGRSDEALARLEALGKRTSLRDADVLQARGDILLYAKRDLEGALKSYADAIVARPDQVIAHFSRIQILLYKKDVEGVRAAYKSLQAIAPGLLQTRLVEAQLAFVENDFSKAKALVQGLLALVPEDVRLLTLSGAISLQTKEFQLGETNLSRAVQLAPGAPLAHKLLAQTHLLMGKPTAAIADLQALMDATPVDTTAVTLAAEAHLALGAFRLADDLYQRALAAAPDDPNVRLAAAVSRLARGDSAGLADLENLAVKANDDVAALAAISARLRRGEPDQALRQADALLARAPGVAKYQDLRGTVLLARGDREGATAAFRQALKIEPSYFPAVKKLSMIEVAARENSAAQKLLEDFTKTFPGHTEGRMSWIDWMIFQKRPSADVAAKLNELIGLDTRYIPARLKLVDLYLAAANPKAALSAAQDAVTAMPDRPELVEALGRAQVATSELQQAQKTYLKLSGLLPRSPMPLIRLADIQVSMNNSAAAESSLRRAVEIAPDRLEARRRLIALAMAGGKPEKALTVAREMRRAQPKSVNPYLFEAEIEVGQKNWPAAANVLQAGMAAGAAPVEVLASQLWVALSESKQAASADELLKKFDKASPAVAVAFFARLADLLMARGDWSSAERMYREVLKRQNSAVGALNNVAWLMAKQGKPGASEMSARALGVAKGNAALWDTHAIALAADGLLPKALEAAERATSIEPEDPGFRLTLARVLMQSKQPQRAREELKRLKALGASFGGAQEVTSMLRALGAD